MFLKTMCVSPEKEESCKVKETAHSSTSLFMSIGNYNLSKNLKL